MVKKQIDPKTTESDSAQPRFHQRAAELQAYGTVAPQRVDESAAGR